MQLVYAGKVVHSLFAWFASVHVLEAKLHTNFLVSSSFPHSGIRKRGGNDTQGDYLLSLAICL